jgi:hypothetical protein
MKVLLALISILALANCGRFLQEHEGVNIPCSLVPFVSYYEKYEYDRHYWYWKVGGDGCVEIDIGEIYYPTDNHYDSEKDCKYACEGETTKSDKENLDPTVVCKDYPGYYGIGYKGENWYYDPNTKYCVQLQAPSNEHPESYNIFFTKQNCEDFCINFLYDYEDKEDYEEEYPPKDDYKDDYKPPKDDYKDDYKPPKDDYKEDYKPPKDDYKEDYKPPNDDYKPPKDDYKEEYPPKDDYKP